MNITNNVANGANVSNLIASSISKLNLNSVKKPELNEKSDVKPKNIKENIKEDEIPLNINEKPKMAIDVKDIQKYADMVGESVSIDDINYGIMYGRSVIADYIA